MQNGVELGSVFPGLVQDQGAWASTNTKATWKDQAHSPLSRSEFQSFFETADSNPFAANGPRSPEDYAGLLNDGTGPGPNPKDDIQNLGAFFKAIASGDVDIDAYFPVGSELGDQIRSQLAKWSDHIGANPDLSSQTSGPNAMSSVEIIENLKAVAAALPSGSEVQKTVLALETLASQVHKQMSDAQQIDPRGARRLGAPDHPSQMGALPSAQPTVMSFDDAPRTFPGVAGPQSNGLNGLGNSGALAQTQSVLGPFTPSSETVSDGSGVPELVAAKGPASPFDPLSRLTVPAPVDQGATGPSAFMKDADGKRRFDDKLPAMPPASSSYGGPDGFAPRPTATWSSPLVAASSSTAQFDAIPPEPLAMDVMSSDPTVEMTVREARTSSPAALGSQMPATQLAQAQPQQIVRQIAIAIQNKASGTFEISLSPAELGSVRISLTTAETGMIVNIQAERQETLDLLRRNTDILAEDFRDLGFDDTSFSFDGSETQNDGPGAHSAVIHHRTDEPLDLGSPVDVDALPEPSPVLNDGAVDIRI